MLSTSAVRITRRVPRTQKKRSSRPNASIRPFLQATTEDTEHTDIIPSQGSRSSSQSQPAPL
jgi:hypothetical protein